VGNRTPQVSVIIPAYNQAQYLKDAIQSVLSQTYQDFEIIVIDDGSTDNTPLIVSQFGNCLRYIRQDNQGLGGARNTGIRAAEG
jgi:glycosyltransferase involved in cell wall biosynthesis